MVIALFPAAMGAHTTPFTGSLIVELAAAGDEATTATNRDKHSVNKAATQGFMVVDVL